MLTLDGLSMVFKADGWPRRAHHIFTCGSVYLHCLMSFHVQRWLRPRPTRLSNKYRDRRAYSLSGLETSMLISWPSRWSRNMLVSMDTWCVVNAPTEWLSNCWSITHAFWGGHHTTGFCLPVLLRVQEGHTVTYNSAIIIFATPPAAR